MKNRVLIVSFFHPELVRGGGQSVAYDQFCAMKDSKSYKSTFLASIDSSYPALYKSGACITGFDGRPDEYIFLAREYDAWWHKVKDFRLLSAFEEFLLLHNPEIVHFHHYMLYGVDFVSTVKRVLPSANVVLTLHEFITICNANGHMTRLTDGSLCERASPVRCHQCFPSRGPEEFFTRKLWMLSHLSIVDVFTCPSEFMLDIYARWGLPSEKLIHVANGSPGLYAALPAASEKRNVFGFFGQFVDAKGILVLLKAVRILRAQGTKDFRVELNGDNLKYASQAMRSEFEEFFKAEMDMPMEERNVFLNGSYDSSSLAKRLGDVDWVVVPSIWWEIFCLVISEAWLAGRPVICSKVGGPQERIVEGRDGLFFDMGNANGLAQVMKNCLGNQDLWDKMHAGITPPQSPKAVLGRYSEVYQTLLAPKATLSQIDFIEQ